MKPIISALALVILTFIHFHQIYAQAVGVGTTTPSPSAKLDITSTTQGLLIPRVTTAQRNGIASPATGLIVYDLDKKTICMYDGASWMPLMYSTTFSKLPPVILGSPPNFYDAGVFGFDIDISGNYAIIGSPFDSINGNIQQGSAFIYHLNNGSWTYQAKLISSDGNDSDNFGKSVAISGDYAIVGSPGWDNVPLHTDNGATYIYQRSGTTWTQVARLTAADAANYDAYGEDVSIDGDYVVIGAPYDASGAYTANGSAYIYYRGSGWTNGHPLQAKVLAADGLTQDWFGISVSVSGDYVLVGANGDDNPMPPLTFMGSAYIFQRSGTSWSQISKLIPDPASNAFYGGDVDINGDYAIIGAPGEQGNKGAAYVYYKGTGWVNNQPQQAKLIHTNATSFDNLGFRVRITDQFALMGGGYYDNEYEDEGGIFIYKRAGTTWSYYRRILDDANINPGLFSHGMGISGNNLVIGAPIKFNMQGQIQSLNIE